MLKRLHYITHQSCLILEWEQYEMSDHQGNGRYPTRPSAAASGVPFFKGPNHQDQGDGKEANKPKKFLKPSKEGMIFIRRSVLKDTQLCSLPFSAEPP
jgi:hypothetical protein